MSTGDVVSTVELAWRVAADTPDPELPMVTVADLGILRDVTVDGSRATAWLTPTYSGCPALREIRADVSGRLAAAGFARRRGAHRTQPAVVERLDNRRGPPQAPGGRHRAAVGLGAAAARPGRSR